MLFVPKWWKPKPKWQTKLDSKQQAASGSSNEKVDKSGKENPKEKKTEGLSESQVEMDYMLLSALLTGVNRAFPFVSSNEADDIVDVQTPIASDRFYRALYSKLLLPAVMNTSKAEMFIALILRAVKRDVNIKRVAAFSKRLLQNTALQNESFDDDELEHFEDVIEETDKEPNGEVAHSDSVSSRSDDDDQPASSEDDDDFDDALEDEGTYQEAFVAWRL
ncbi:hypothetical protein KIW84_075324 [Lathyrus oleraceus]|uniref:CCAAT-binding factor domain-containing protein n=1 Tax=Pisum sativum TaxID=3888 RepID=A0A9D4ZXY3_PEA|nr:hypothetical protein KIW84_075324 [Pisum sativum]